MSRATVSLWLFSVADTLNEARCDLFFRTLLALGCHVGMGDEKAEENLKRTKLPKT